MGVEGGAAWKYWNEFSQDIPEKYDFCYRMDYRRPVTAGDMVNVFSIPEKQKKYYGLQH